MIAASPLEAQENPLDAIVRSGPTLTQREAAGSCPNFVIRAPREFANLSSDSVVLETRCTVDSSYALPMADGARWIASIYRRMYVVPSDSIAIALHHVARDTGVLITALLYSAAPRDSIWRAEWIGTVDESTTRSLTPTLARQADASALVSLRYCVNGTGGCWQTFLHRRNRQWTEVVAAFLKQLPVVPDVRVGGGAGVDVSSLKARYGVYGSGDPNCCPSREILLELRLRRDSLVLETYRIRPSQR